MSDSASRVTQELLALPSPNLNFRDGSGKFRAFFQHILTPASIVPRDLSAQSGQEHPTPNVHDLTGITFAFVALFDYAPELKQKTKECQGVGREA